ncbi:GspJ family T2SS minor pseudopilin variant LspJ [Legionella feeleii]|uniref:Type II secretion system protein J n=1 Tax=Legionella feeleii TaxID=453 RepID=A0A378IT40_9GAMM|nr:GspJ family T2SS minor pseudopilin variant LspJ [Legionella feeleii]STX38408.1 general secretion pathway protein J [Legionella feeleii]
MIKQQGFTLLEILIALVVFAILASLCSSAMYNAFHTQKQVAHQAEQLNALQLAVTLIERDTKQAVERSVRGNEMHIFPPFVGQAHYLEFTRTGVANPEATEKRSTLQRIAYLCDKHQLIRRSWETLDTVERSDYEDQSLLDGLEDCEFAYLNHSLQVLPEWFANALQQNQRKEPFPKAIQLSLTLKTWGKMSFLLIIPEGLYSA